MYDYYEESPYYEPTLADEILIEYQQKMKDALLESKYVPAISATTMIKFSKRDSRYSSERKFYFSRSYFPVNNRDRYDYDYQEFKIYHVANEYNESIIELHKNKPYGERLGFKSKEECQKYCDWLNKKDDYCEDIELDDE